MSNQILCWSPLVFTGILLLVVWSMVWKGIALWKCGRNDQLGWYVILFIINTAGILEMIYLAFFQKRR